MGSEFTAAQNHLLEQIATENGFTDYTIQEYSTASRGDNYIAEIKCVTIKDRNGKLEVVVKKAPNSEDFRKFFPLEHIFHTEIHVYETLFETFKKFQKEYHMRDIFEHHAKFFGKCEIKYNECLVLENLLQNGYKHWNRKIPMNADHIKLVLETYGKFHAVSLAMRKQDPETFNNLLKELKEPKEWENNNFNGFLESTIPAIEKAVSGYPILETAFQRLTTDLHTYFYELSLGPYDTNVITHGDCWNNNMLFKYEDPDDAEKPTKVCLIDWQIAKFGSPFMDISYFFCSSSIKEILEDYKTYLKVYHDSVSEQLRQMSCDPEKLFPYENLEGEFKKYARYGVMVGSFVFRMLYVDSKDAPVVNKGTTSMEEFYEQFKNLENEVVNERIRDLLTFMVDHNFI